MREDFLHYIWKFRKLSLAPLMTSEKMPLVILNYGAHNQLSGPDFINARVLIGGQQWAGNVEIHLKSSDWYLHNHQNDSRYENVVLHVVWKNDIPVFRRNGSVIPTLELYNFISEKLLFNYKRLLRTKPCFINCERQLKQVNSFVLEHWLERLYIERLEQKSEEIGSLLKASDNNWERTLFLILLRSFGLKINGASFMSIGKAINFSTLLKTKGNPHQLESILFGLAGMLNSDDIKDTYYLSLQAEYRYLRKKFELDSCAVIPPDFFKLRPANFPTIRLAQFALVYAKPHLFSSVINARTREDFQNIFKLELNDYWKNHFVFGKSSARSPKRISDRFIDLITINTFIPLKFSYARYLGQEINETLLGLIREIKGERNSVIANFNRLGIASANAMKSQAVMQLYNGYCVKNKCLQCAVGIQLLNGK